MPDRTPSDVVEYPSDRPFAETVDRVTRAIRTAGLRVFAVVDHAAGAREVGLDLRPAMLLIYGHPKGGTPIMQASPLVALDLPLRVLIREDAEGATRVAFCPIVPLLARSGVPESLARGLVPAQTLLVDALRT